MSLDNYFKSLLFVLGITAIFSQFFGFYSHSASDTLLKGMMSGIYSGEPLNIPTTFKAFVGTSHVLTWLYTHFPKLPWYDLLIFSCIALSITNGLVLYSGKKDMLGNIICLVLIFNASFTIEFTEVAILLAFSSALLISYTDVKKIKGFLFFLVILSFLLRIEAGLFALIIVLPFIFYRYKNLDRFGQALLLISIFSGVSLLTLSKFETSKVDKRFNSIKPYVYSFWNNSHYLDAEDFGEKGNVVVQSGVDSFIGDSTFYNNEYLSQIGVPYKDRSLESFVKFLDGEHSRFVPKINALLSYCGKHIELIVIFFLVSVLYYRRIIHIVLIAFYILALLYVITYLMKMEDRIFVPVMVSSIFGVMITGERKRIGNNLLYGSICIMIIAALTINITKFYKTQMLYKRYVPKVENFSSDLSAAYERPLIINFTTLHLFNRKLFSQNDQLSNEHDFVTIDDVWMYMYPEHEDHLRKFIPVDRYGNFKKYFIKLIQKDYLLLSQKFRLDILNNYVKNIYGLEIEAKKVFKNIEMDLERKEKFDLNLYQVSLK